MTITTLAASLKIDPKRARRILRTNGVKAKDGRYHFTKTQLPRIKKLLAS